MRIFSFIPALAALATAVAGVALPRQDDCGFEIGCELAQSASKRDFSGGRAARNAPGLTNAALLRRGLPLKNPIMRRDTPDHRPKPSEKPTPPLQNIGPGRFRALIAIKRKADGKHLGYVSSCTLNHAQYQYKDISSALVVTFDAEPGQVSQINLRPENSDITDFTFLGLVQGRDDVDSTLAAGSHQYTYLAGTNPTAPGSPPANVGNSYTRATGLSRTSESAVWTYDPATGNLTPIWVNPDKCIPKLDYFVQSTAIYVGGDAHAFNDKYRAPVTLITFELVGLN